MTNQSRLATAARRDVPRVAIVQLSAAALQALADGDLAAANRAAAVPLTRYFVDPDWRSTWRRRAQQVKDDRTSLDWVTGVIWDVERQLAVGRAGYHGPPDETGMVEVGYAVAPAYRRQGYARAALEALLGRAARVPGVRTVRASIRPDNTASRDLVVQYRFREVGTQEDDEDGLEIIYEVDVAGTRSATP